MTNQISNNQTGLEKLAETVEGLVTGIPAPIRKNFFKAFSQLCTAAVDIPVAKMESKAAEIRAESQARIEILKKEGIEIGKNIKIPAEYISKASEKFASKIVKEQLNLDKISLNAAQNLAGSAIDSESETGEINEDWLNEFETLARLKSSEEMQIVFGKILSGEIQKPGKYSIRTVRIISQLDNEAAKLFQILCSLSVSLRTTAGIIDARVVSFEGSAGENSLKDYGLSYSNLNILTEYGLINSEYNSNASYMISIPNMHPKFFLGLTFENVLYSLNPINDEFDKSAKLYGVSFTKAGIELLDSMPIEPNEKYKEALIEFFKKKNLTLTKL